MSKYHAVPTEIDGIRFASKREAARYGELKLLWKAGEIDALICHPGYEIKVNDQLICNYIADFSYLLPDGSMVVEDVKGVKTPVYRLKKKLLRATWGIDIVEVE